VNPQRLVILGSTGSIGCSTLDVVVKHPGRFEIVALAAYSNAALLADQCLAHHPQHVCLVDDTRRDELEQALANEQVELHYGLDDLVALAELSEADTIVNAVVGAAGMHASLAALKAGKRLALANKESLVAAGPLFPDIIEKAGGMILPIDSEHSAIWQALQAGRMEDLKRIIITASGGPFLRLPAEEFENITLEQALDHPTWKMGPKITIDSSTLANKGLEVIEAVALFQVPAEQVAVVVHPQSIVHSMVEFRDSSVIAQMSQPDMRLPITLALFWPERVDSDYGHLAFDTRLDLSFEPPDLDRFPALRLAFEVATAGGTAPAIYNAANEIAVESFLNRSVKYTDISRIIAHVVDKIDVVSNPQLEDIVEADRLARTVAANKVGALA
jgi:1-deoxy-D-xylulose-5-phosphate reductoisomerase